MVVLCSSLHHHHLHHLDCYSKSNRWSSFLLFLWNYHHPKSTSLSSLYSSDCYHLISCACYYHRSQNESYLWNENLHSNQFRKDSTLGIIPPIISPQFLPPFLNFECTCHPHFLICVFYDLIVVTWQKTIDPMVSIKNFSWCNSKPFLLF